MESENYLSLKISNSTNILTYIGKVLMKGVDNVRLEALGFANVKLLDVVSILQGQGYALDDVKLERVMLPNFSGKEIPVTRLQVWLKKEEKGELRK